MPSRLKSHVCKTESFAIEDTIVPLQEGNREAENASSDLTLPANEEALSKSDFSPTSAKRRKLLTH